MNLKNNYPRVGNGFDVHKFIIGRKLIIGGVDIPHSKGLDGHSDADVLTHSIMDAMLGAVALGDIGKHFPDTDDVYKNANSLHLLKHILVNTQLKNYSLINLDAIIIAEKPKMSKYIDLIRQNYANIFKCDLDRISIKATTTEKLGFTGRGEGIAATAIVNIIKNF